MAVQTLPQSADGYARVQRQEIGAAVSAVSRLWRRMGADFDESYRALEPSLLAVVQTAQERVAAGAQQYVPDVLEDTGQARAAEPFARVSTSPLVGVAGDGRPVDSLLYEAVIGARVAVADGATATQALAQRGQWLSMTVGTLLSDTGRHSESLAMGVRPVAGYARMLNPPSCSRCAILAGKYFRKNQGFQRHPGCLPAGAIVSGPEVERATRRWYEGELVTVRTASGQELSMTANHPVLTDRGWLPAELLNEGSYVVSRAVGDRAVGQKVPNHDQVPARIEDVWGANDMRPLGRVPVAAEDFHGDGLNGHVDVVLPDRLLWDRSESAVFEQLRQVALAVGPELAVSLADAGARGEFGGGYDAPARGGVGVLGLPSQGVGFGVTHAHKSGGAAVADLDALLSQSAADGFSAYAESFADGVLALAEHVGVGDSPGVERQDSSRWDPPAGPFTVESRGAYADRGKDLFLRLAGQVALDRIVEVTRVQWSGHVYNLTTVEGWYDANGIIVSNCDCRHIPASESVGDDLTVNVAEYFDTLSAAEQDRVFTKAGAEAVRNGADINQVVNARRGMQTAQIGGRDTLITLEGTTRRAEAYRFLAPSGTAARQGEYVTRLTRNGPETRRVTRNAARRPRLMPETIQRVATDQADYLRLLRANGYLING